MFDFRGGNQETILSRRHGFNTVGPVAVVLLILLSVRLGLHFAGVLHAFPIAIGVTAVAVFSRMKLRARLNAKKRAQAIELRKQLHDLKEAEIELLIQDAKMNGKFDRWGDK